MAIKKIILIILGLLVLGGIIFVLCLQKAYSEWKTFTSESCGFSVDYPSDWTAEKWRDTGLVLMSAEYLASMELARNSGHIFEAPGFTALVNCAPSLEVFAKESGYGELKTGDTLGVVLSANDEQAKKIEFGDYDEAYEVVIGGLGVTYEIAIGENGRIYTIFFPDAESMEQLDEDERRILESFRLME